MQHIVPKQCSAITTKGKRCRNQAVPGTGTCKVHSRPSPGDPSYSARHMAKIGLQIFLEAVVKIGIQKTIEYIVTLMSAWKTLKRPPFTEKTARKITLEDLGDWYSSLNPQWQKRILRALKNAKKKPTKKNRTFTANGNA